MKNIIFIHGMFQNSKSWDKWQDYFTARGYNCMVPDWPLHEGEPLSLRQNPPAGLGDLHLDDIIVPIETLALQMEKPILIGHSVGGLIVQLLLNRGVASAGVAISPVAPNAMLDFDWGFFKNSALIANPFKGNEPFFMDEKSFHGSFANTLSEQESNVAYQEFATHDSRNVLRDCMGTPGEMDLDLPHAPLLMVAAEQDEIIPNTLVKKNFEAYKDQSSQTAFKEFPNRSHYICGEPGWEEVAAHVADWLDRLPAST